MLDLINRVYVTMWTRLRREEGQTFVEYAVITAVVALGVAALLGAFSTSIGDAFSSIATKLGTYIP